MYKSITAAVSSFVLRNGSNPNHHYLGGFTVRKTPMDLQMNLTFVVVVVVVVAAAAVLLPPFPTPRYMRSPCLFRNDGRNAMQCNATDGRTDVTQTQSNEKPESRSC